MTSDTSTPNGAAPAADAAPVVPAPASNAAAQRSRRPAQSGETFIDPFQHGRDFGDGSGQGGAGSKQFQLTFVGGKKLQPNPNGKYFICKPFVSADRQRFGFSNIIGPDRAVRTWAATDAGIKACIAFFEQNGIASHNGKQNTPRTLLGTMFSRDVCKRFNLPYDKGIGSNGGGTASGYVIGK